MEKQSKLTPRENLLIDNIINKLQLYMTRNNQNLYSLATTLGFAYQPFYRLIKNRNLPTISSLAMIAEHLSCSIEELISDKVFLDIPVIKNFEQIAKLDKLNKSATIRIYIPYTEYLPYVHDKFFAIKANEPKLEGIDHCKIYTVSQRITTDGQFIVKYQDKITNFEVISTSSKFIITELNNTEQRITHDQFVPLAKFFHSALVSDLNSSYIQGVKL